MEEFDPTKALATEKEKVQKALENLYKSFTPAAGLGFGKRVGDSTHIAVERITEVGKQELLLNKLATIEEAEEAVRNGSYGKCKVCKTSIPTDRLAIRPQSLTCIAHS